MKSLYQIIVFLIFQSAAVSLCNAVESYLPLKVGNSWTYKFIPHQPGIGILKITINEEVILNSKKYFRCSFPTISDLSSLLRVDSLSGNLYGYTTSGCSGNEILIDSLFSAENDSTVLCGNPYRLCRDTGYTSIFGNSFQKKIFVPVFVLTARTRAYAKNIGLYYIEESDPSPTIYTLKGCVIDGVVYGDTTVTSVGFLGNYIPENFSLSQNYPNPFNPKTIINYQLSMINYVQLKVYDALGKEIAVLVNEKQSPGSYGVEFDGSGLASGIYFYTLSAGNFSETKRMILLK